MESTLNKYAGKIERNEVNPHVWYDGHASGLIFDPRQEGVPLEVLGFGVYRLGPELVTTETLEKEMVLVPQEGEFEVEINGKRFGGARSGGPFAARPGKSNASALYIPCNTRLGIRGKGEMAFFEAPALRELPALYLSPEEVTVVSRGEWIWRRDVISLISPNNASSNLIVGETYNPPGFWSGTPIHRHDRDQPAFGESDHEEVYYHRFGWNQGMNDQFAAYGVQLLMDGKGLNKAYVIGDKSAFAIPGGCHPVVASPVSELLYLWGLAGRGGELAMKDVPEFAHLKTFEEIFKQLAAEPTQRIISAAELESLAAKHALTQEQTGLLTLMLKEKGFDIG
ncbi:MAG: 5-deoxy-glucuronate isomerase [Desulfomonile tiedjei]|nr:5-deoxy-glucuronate isomerase [Desulfomonile tiedjei]